LLEVQRRSRATELWKGKTPMKQGKQNAVTSRDGMRTVNNMWGPKSQGVKRGFTISINTEREKKTKGFYGKNMEILAGGMGWLKD